MITPLYNSRCFPQGLSFSTPAYHNSIDSHFRLSHICCAPARRAKNPLLTDCCVFSFDVAHFGSRKQSSPKADVETCINRASD